MAVGAREGGREGGGRGRGGREGGGRCGTRGAPAGAPRRRRSGGVRSPLLRGSPPFRFLPCCRASGRACAGVRKRGGGGKGNAGRRPRRWRRTPAGPRRPRPRSRTSSRPHPHSHQQRLPPQHAHLTPSPRARRLAHNEDPTPSLASLARSGLDASDGFERVREHAERRACDLGASTDELECCARDLSEAHAMAAECEAALRSSRAAARRAPRWRPPRASAADAVGAALGRRLAAAGSPSPARRLLNRLSVGGGDSPGGGSARGRRRRRRATDNAATTAGASCASTTASYAAMHSSTPALSSQTERERERERARRADEHRVQYACAVSRVRDARERVRRRAPCAVRVRTCMYDTMRISPARGLNPVPHPRFSTRRARSRREGAAA